MKITSVADTNTISRGYAGYLFFSNQIMVHYRKVRNFENVTKNGVDSMRFQPYVPEYNAQQREVIGVRKKEDTIEDIVRWKQVFMEENFIQSRRPFYRVYPGVIGAMTRLGIEKLDVSKIHPPTNPLSLEFPVSHPLQGGTRQIRNLLFMEMRHDDSLFIAYTSHVGTFGVLTFPREHDQIIKMFDQQQDADQPTFKSLLQMVFGICMIPQSDSDLMTPLVLNKDKEKFAISGDPKYIERARRNGMNGWSVGQDIPTPEEMAALREQTDAGESGRKSPHWRMGHFAIRYTGEGRSIPVVTWIKEAFVNKDLYRKMPTGYHGKAESDSPGM